MGAEPRGEAVGGVGWRIGIETDDVCGRLSGGPGIEWGIGNKGKATRADGAKPEGEPVSRCRANARFCIGFRSPTK